MSWSSKLQPFVTGSTAEVEYIAAYFAGLELMFLRNFLEELGYSIPDASTFYVDNQPAIAVAKNPEHHGKMKHICVKYFWLQERVEEGKIHVVHCSTAQLPADLLTKPLGRQKVENCLKLLGLVDSGGSV